MNKPWESVRAILMEYRSGHETTEDTMAAIAKALAPTEQAPPGPAHIIPQTGNLADQRLMASAPELLEACKAALDYLSPMKAPMGTQGASVICKLQDAIAKAERQDVK